MSERFPGARSWGVSPLAERIAIIGAGGFAREVLDVLEAWGDRYIVEGFVVDAAYGRPGDVINGRPVLGGREWLKAHRDDVVAVCGIGAPEVRRRLVQAAALDGVRFASVIHPSVISTRWVTVGSGSVICAGAILTNQIRLGEHVHVNLGCTIGHDTVVEAFATFSPGVHLSGNVTVREGAYVGTGASVIEKCEIGAWSVIGAGAAVVRSIPADSTCVGVPAKVIRTRPAGWHESTGTDET